MIGKLIAYGFLMQLKEAQQNEQECNDIPLNEQRYVVNNIADSELLSIQSNICNDPLTTLYSGESLQSISTFTPYSIYNNTLSSSLSSSTSLSITTITESLPLSQSHASSSSSSQSAHSLWRYYNDSQLKFGWILTTTAKEVNEQCGTHCTVLCSEMLERSEIIFKIKLSEQPKIQISYLKSYTG